MTLAYLSGETAEDSLPGVAGAEGGKKATPTCDNGDKGGEVKEGEGEVREEGEGEGVKGDGVNGEKRQYRTGSVEPSEVCMYICLYIQYVHVLYTKEVCTVEPLYKDTPELRTPL